MEYMESRMQDQIEGAQLAHEQAMKAGAEPAFPAPEASVAVYGHADYLTGITIRDYFAAKALVTVSAYRPEDVEGWHPEHFANHAYAIADAMLAARTK
jgi:hypothetical protein